MSRISTDQVREAHDAEPHGLATLRYGAHLKRVGAGEYAGPCPACGGRDRFSINVNKRLWNCRGCARGGDAIALVQHVDNCSFAEAVHSLTGGPWTPVTPAKAIPISGASLAADDRMEAAERIWREAGPIVGSGGAAYLAARGIDLTEVPGHGGLRWHKRCPWGSGTAPCIVARYTNAVTAAPRGIWRRPTNGEKPKSLGPTGGCVIELWPRELVVEGALVVLGEGVETTLAAATRLTWRGHYLRPAWASGSAGGMAGFPVIACVESIILLVDHDDNRTGELASEQCEVRWLAAGRETQRLMPEGVGEDFNDLVRP
jgi:hypothetical protein